LPATRTLFREEELFSVLYIVTGSRWSMGAASASVISKLEENVGAEVIELSLGRRRRGVFVSKFQTALLSLNPRLLRLRQRWADEDDVFVIGWYVIPILILLGIRLLPRPRRLVSLATFMHDARLRQAVNYLLRVFKTDRLEFIVFSQAESANLVGVVGIPPERVHRVLYRGKWSADEVPERIGGYIFTGGHTNRDYATFFRAVAPLQYDIVAVASPLNDLSDPPPNVDVRIASPLDEFERLVAGCSVLVLPLRAGGEACGQTVLVSGIRYNRPIVATRHDSLIDYLGHDYPGFVPAHDVEALRCAITRALSDQLFRESLLNRVNASAHMLKELGDFEEEFLRILVPIDVPGRAA
jgi:glycosyltransferase involved in cell wall biosynthesis